MADRGFDGKVALMAGGSHGMGRASAERLAAGGAKVVVGSRRQLALDDVVAVIRDAGGEATDVAADVSTTDGARQLVEATIDPCGGLDILVNSQCIQRYGTVQDTSAALWDEVMTVNVRSMYVTARFAIPVMRRRGGGVSASMEASGTLQFERDTGSDIDGGDVRFDLEPIETATLRFVPGQGVRPSPWT